VIYPQNTGIDVSIDRSQNATIPNDVSNAQQLANKLAATAFATNIDDDNTSTDTTLSSSKIDSELIRIDNDLRGGYSGTMQDLANNITNSSGSTIDDSVTANNSTWSSSKISSEIGYGISNYDTNLRDGYVGTLKDLYDTVNDNSNISVENLPSVDPTTPRCILQVMNNIVYSKYGYTLDILHEILDSGVWNNYIKNGDYINLITKNGDQYKMMFNIDTYYDANANGTTSKIARHHIDMISQDLIPNSNWRMRTEDFIGGTALQKNPYISSNGGNCVKDNLAKYYINNIPDIIKDYIIKKQLVVPYIYTTDNDFSSLFSVDANGKGLEEMPELWIPFLGEVNSPSSYYYEDGLLKYPIFNKSSTWHKYNEYGSASSWWLASARGSKSTSNGKTTYSRYFCNVNRQSSYSDTSLPTSYHYTPLCFRFV
jgi:hypothetical protein